MNGEGETMLSIHKNMARLNFKILYDMIQCCYTYDRTKFQDFSRTFQDLETENSRTTHTMVNIKI